MFERMFLASSHLFPPWLNPSCIIMDQANLLSFSLFLHICYSLSPSSSLIEYPLYIQVAAECVQVLNAVKSKLPFLVTTAEDAKDYVKEEIRLR